jgi:ectoine hydroxylase-related dioxygenase (phytanoyl-CoA dioxygenase family)
MAVVDIQSAVANYRAHGFAVLPGAVPGEVVDAAEAVLDFLEASWERQLQHLPDARSWISHAGEITFTARLAGSEPVLRDMLVTRALSEFMRAILGSSVRLYFDQAVYKKPHCEQIVPWHQDNGYNPKIPADYISLWIAISDTTVANGTIRFQPGKHRQGPRSHSRTSGGYLVCEAGADGGVSVPLRRGDVVAFSSLLPHATGPNTTSRVRKAYIASCVRDGTRLVDGTWCDDPVNQPVLIGDAA